MDLKQDKIVTVEAKPKWEPLTKEERQLFHDQGYVVVKNALNKDRLEEVNKVVDSVYEEEEAAGNLLANDWLHLQGAAVRNKTFTELLETDGTFRWIWGLLGWNIQTHHNHLDVNPPLGDRETKQVWSWHQDGWRQNSDAETLEETHGYYMPRPQFSVKVALVLSDMSVEGRGGTMFIPGSHLNNSLARQDPGGPQPEGAVQLTAEAGDAFLFDRRMWHDRSDNRSEITRKIFFMGFTHRWIRQLDPMPVDKNSDYWKSLTSVQKQLIGDGPNEADFWGIHEAGGINDKIPLRAKLIEHDLLDRSIPWLR